MKILTSVSSKLFLVWMFHALLVKIRSSRQEVFCKKGVLKNFTKFKGKHQCQSLFFNKVARSRPVLYLISLYFLELLVAEYLREIINFYLSLMFICTIAAFKTSSKKKETEIEKEIVRCSIMLLKAGTEVKVRDNNILDFDLVFMG